MWLELNEEQIIVFEAAKLSSKTYGYARGGTVTEAHTEFFSPVSEHEIDTSSKERHGMLLEVFQTFFTILEIFK
ncbi:hypothetical protein CHL76_08455 [Marinococcus halophilus]|uniref:Uncharacterized protein n=1 Tax=Marinococcus halophilus TaxID=1371 RepID=A0A510Y6T2_MARHA|nr:hypothetical protein [Marinococcus halophilus]OZT80129.1 hypothetical protein CHL76_08455 [Marinococcus halophilus]GEK58177.1 hypothetical protein MHA01_10820 [Marinococcus halophilus]